MRLVWVVELTGWRVGALLDGPDEEDLEGIRTHLDGEGNAALLTRENNIPLRSVHAAAAYIPFITDSRKKVKEEMEAMVLQGLGSLVRSIYRVFTTRVLIVSAESIIACVFTADSL